MPSGDGFVIEKNLPLPLATQATKQLQQQWCTDEKCSTKSEETSVRGHRSFWWKHFYQKKTATVEMKSNCKYCSASYIVVGTGNLRNHMIKKHPEKLTKDK